jgi:hypothetical protein
MEKKLSGKKFRLATKKRLSWKKGKRLSWEKLLVMMNEVVN